MANDSKSDALIAAVLEIVGPAGLLRGEEMAPYLQGARYGDGRAAFVARPGSREEVAAVVALCAEHDVPLVAQGANTGLVGASTPDDSGAQVVLSLTRLRRHCEVDAVNRSVDVDAGVLLHDLNDRLEPHGLWFPIDLAADPTVGGMIATNTGGTRLLRYGDVRHNLLALEVVLFDPPGKLVRLGSPLRKNNTGFDLKQLFVGTSGAPGIIVGATLEVAPRPRQSATCLVEAASEDAVTQLLVAAEAELGDFLSAFEGLSRSAVQAALDHVPSLRSPFGHEPVPEFSLLIEVSSASATTSSAADVEQRLLEFLEQRIGSDISNAVMGKGEDLWNLRHSLSDGAKALGRIIGFDLSVRRSDVMRFRRDAAALIQERYPYVRIVDFGHVGDGGLHFNLVWPHDSDTPYDHAQVVRMRDDIYDLVVVRFRGSYSAEHGVGPQNHSYYVKYTDETTLCLSGKLQHLFDPEGLGHQVSFGPSEIPCSTAEAIRSVQ